MITKRPERREGWEPYLFVVGLEDFLGSVADEDSEVNLTSCRLKVDDTLTSAGCLNMNHLTVQISVPKSNELSRVELSHHKWMISRTDTVTFVSGGPTRVIPVLSQSQRTVLFPSSPELLGLDQEPNLVVVCHTDESSIGGRKVKFVRLWVSYLKIELMSLARVLQSLLIDE